MLDALARRWAELRDRVPAPVQAIAPDLWRGVRGALATLVPFFLAGLWQRPELTWTALGGWLGTLADPGGTREARLRVLGGFAIVGGLFVAVSTAASRDAWLAAIVLGIAAFGASFLRALGATGASVGTLLAVVFAIGIGRVHGEPLRDAGYFALGAGWAVVLSSIVWPIGTHVPVRRACARALRELAAYASALRAAAREGTPLHDPRWSMIARQHRRRSRDALEEARVISLAVRARGPGASALGVGLRVLVGLLEQQLAVLVTLGEEAEAAPIEARSAWIDALDRVEAADLALARAVTARIFPAAPRIERISSDAPRSACARSDALLRELAEVVASLDHPREDPAPAVELQAAPRVMESLRALRDALSPRSSVFVHALRVAGVALIAALVGRAVSPHYAHWVTVTAIGVLQPYPGVTYRRAIERVIGTVLGTGVAVVVAATAHDPRALAAVMFPLSVAAVATRPRSYRLFTLFLTPVFVLLAEQAPGAPGQWEVAVARVGDAAIGGLVAVLASVAVLPSWERERLPDAMATMFDAVATYAHAVFARWRAPSAETDAHMVATRRAAGVALGNAETSLERMLSEPGRAPDTTEALDLVTYARRLAGALTAIATAAHGAPAPEGLVAIEGYVDRTLALAKARFTTGEAGVPSPEPPIVDLALDAGIAARLESVVRFARLLGERRHASAE